MTDKGLHCYSLGRQRNQDCIEMVRIARGVDMATITSVTRAVSAALDEADVVPSAYTLEVSSPGLERALRTPEHFAGAVGSEVLRLALADTPSRDDVSWTVGLKNLAYTMQWWVFGAFAIFMWWRMSNEQVAAARPALATSR